MKIFISKSRINLLPALILLLIFALLAYRIFRAPASGNLPLTPPIKKGKIMEAVYGIGTVMANKSYDLNSGVKSIVMAVFIKEGDRVLKNQKLINLDGQIIKAPFSGIITYLPFKDGEIVFQGNRVLSLVDFLERYLVVNLEQEGALKIKTGQKGKIDFDSIRDQTFEGTVESVYSQDSSFLARIGISHLPTYILPGMTADVAIEIREHLNVMVIPVAALQDGHVTVHNQNKSKKKVQVKIGLSDGVMAEILSGDLKEGDRLVIPQELED